MVRKLKVGSVLFAVALVAACGGSGSKADAGPDAGSGVTPRLISPLSTTMVRDLRPTLRWTGGEGDTFTLEVSSSLDLSEIIHTWTGEGFEHVPPTDLPAGATYWRVCLADDPGECSPTWMFFAGRVPHDVNGDGYSDILVSQICETSARLFLGGESIAGDYTQEDADVVFDTYVGIEQVSLFGDITGNGISDIVLTIDDTCNENKMRICEGKENWPVLVDLDEMWECHTIKRPQEPECVRFGSHPMTNQDSDLDGVFDLVAGNPSENTTEDQAGAVFFFLSGRGDILMREWADEADLKIYGTEYGNFLHTKGFVEDMTGNGYPELLLSLTAKNYYGVEWKGEAYIMRGGPHLAETPVISVDDIDVVLGIDGVNNGFWGMAGAGDVNGDGYGDLLVGMKIGVEKWAVVIRGGPDLPGHIDDESDFILTRIRYPGPDTDAGSDMGLFSPGDINGNGYSDIVLTVFGADSNPYFQSDPLGGIYVFFGGPDLPGEMDGDDADIFIAGNGDPWFAKGYGPVGDVNGDGYADFAVSATGDGCWNNWDEFPGRVFVFFGGPTLGEKETADDADMVISSTIPNAWFGWYVNGTI